jgi:hypothetical protein
VLGGHEGGVKKKDKNRISTTKPGYRAFSIDVLSAALYLERLTTPSGVQFTIFFFLFGTLSLVYVRDVASPSG